MYGTRLLADMKTVETVLLDFTAISKTAQEEKELRTQVENAKDIRNTLKMDLIDSQYYHSAWLENPEGSAKRKQWIKWLDKWGFIDALNN